MFHRIFLTSSWFQLTAKARVYKDLTKYAWYLERYMLKGINEEPWNTIKVIINKWSKWSTTMTIKIRTQIC